MKLLFDTHFLVWIALGGRELTQRERTVLDQDDLEVVCSAVSLWELRLKWNRAALGAGPSGPIAPDDLLRVAQAAGWTLLPLRPEHAVTALDVPLAHKDPFDELLLVQAQVEGLRLLTRDKALLGHPLALS